MTKEIQQALMKQYYLRGHLYCCTNFLGCGYWEADVFTINKSFYTTEFEVKVSRSDFKADFKKERKHETLSGKRPNNQFCNAVNRFYYVCPEEMIKVNEVPAYAGLIYFKDGLLVEVKSAPLIHKGKAHPNLIFKMCQVHSARVAIGGSLLAYKNKESKAFYDALNKE